MILKAQATKERTDKRLHQIRDFATNDIKKDKRQLTIWEKQLQIIYLLQDLYPQYVKKTHSNNKIRQKPNLKKSKQFNRHFTEEHLKVANSHMYIQNHQILGNEKPTPQCNIALLPLV